MKNDGRYRRMEDEGTRMLILLSERVEVLQKSLKDLSGARIKYLEKIIWAVVFALFLLTLEVILKYTSG